MLDGKSIETAAESELTMFPADMITLKDAPLRATVMQVITVSDFQKALSHVDHPICPEILLLLIPISPRTRIICTSPTAELA